MKKEYKFLALSILSLFILNILAITPASAQGTPIEKLSTTFLDLFKSWEQGVISANVAKIIFFVMVTLLIMLVLGGIFTGWNQTIVIIISALVGFLATAYITPSEVYSLLSSYSALGLTLTTLIPLLILSGLTYQAATATKGNVQMIMMQYLAWIVFFVYSLYRFIYDWGWAKEGSGAVNGIILGTTIIALIITLANKQIRTWLIRSHIEALKEAAGKKSEEAAAEIKLLSGMLEETAGETPAWSAT